VVGNPDKNVWDTVMINISQASYGEPEETPELGERNRHLKKRVVEFTYLTESCPVDEESSSHILRRTKPIVDRKLSIVEGPSDDEIGNSITSNVTDYRNALPEVGAAIFDLRIHQR